MKKINGITFAELHNLQPEEIHDLQASFAINQIRENLPKDGPFANPVVREKFIEIGVKHMLRLFKENITEEQILGMRKIYDTEERFNIGADMMDRLGNISMKLQNMVNDIIEEMMDRGILD